MSRWDLAKRYALQTAVTRMVALLSRSDVNSVVRLTRLGERLAPNENLKAQMVWIRDRFQEGHPATQLALRILKELHPRVRTKLVRNLFIQNTYLGYRRRRELEEELGVMVPYLVVISPTMRCNLNCYGCYAGAYRQEEDLSFEMWDSILQQMKDLGIYFATISGGEPFVRGDELLALAEKHNDMTFQIYTNGTLIDEDMVERLVKVGNVYPAISVEGFEKETDARRGRGTFSKIVETMQNLREAGVLFGFSGTVTRKNVDMLASDEFIDFYVKLGTYFGWFFNYIPIGRAPDMELMPTPEQRNRMRLRTLEIRRTRPIFVADFWNDGALTSGCMAGGRIYLHINHRGDIEPCVFAHFAVDNVHKKSLREAIVSPFFRAIQQRQPADKNMLRPCMIIDHPEVLREIVAETGAHATDDGGEKLLTERAAALDKYSAAWGKLADKAWEQEDYSWGKPGGILADPATQGEEKPAEAEEREKVGVAGH